MVKHDNLQQQLVFFFTVCEWGKTGSKKSEPWWKEWDFEDIEGFIYQVGLLVKGTTYRKFISSFGGGAMASQ